MERWRRFPVFVELPCRRVQERTRTAAGRNECQAFLQDAQRLLRSAEADQGGDFPPDERSVLRKAPQDNGEGVNAPPDRATGVYAFDDYLAHPDYRHEIIADLEAWVPPPGAVVGWTTVIRGNVQVKGAGEP